MRLIFSQRLREHLVAIVVLCLMIAPAEVSAAVNYDKLLTIQPIQVCTDGGVCANVTQEFNFDAVQAVWDQALIKVEVLPWTVMVSNVFINVGNPPYVARFGNLAGFPEPHAGSTNSKVVNIWFVKDLREDVTGADVSGYVKPVGGRGIIVDDQGVARLDTIAHEIGHSLGLDHITGSSSLMNQGRSVPTSVNQIIAGTHSQLSDPEKTAARASQYLTVYAPGASFEADVAPRSNGDGQLAVDDWVQVGRFAAGLDAAATGTEFQRADCAPKNTLGDNSISVADWVQAGRYAAGLDAATAVGGPTGALMPSPAAAAEPGEASPQTADGGPLTAVEDLTHSLRVLALEDSSGSAAIESATLAVENESHQAAPMAVGSASARGGLRVLASRTLHGRVKVPIELDASNPVAGAGFNVAFDPSILRFRQVLNSVGNSTSLLVNPFDAGRGTVGIAVAKGFGESFGAGKSTLVEMVFDVIQSQPSATTVGFGSGPVRPQLVDEKAATISASFSSGTVEVTSVEPMILAARMGSDGSMELSWPGVSGLKYRVLAAESLSGLEIDWVAVQEVVAIGVGESVLTTARVPVAVTGNRFYRVELAD